MNSLTHAATPLVEQISGLLAATRHYPAEHLRSSDRVESAVTSFPSGGLGS